MMPRFTPIMAAWVRSFAPNLERMFRTWPFTVSSLTDSCSAISLLASPCAISRKHPNFRRCEGVVAGMLGKFVEASAEIAFLPAWTARMVPAVPHATSFSAGSPERRL